MLSIKTRLKKLNNCAQNKLIDPSKTERLDLTTIKTFICMLTRWSKNVHGNWMKDDLFMCL